MNSKEIIYANLKHFNPPRDPGLDSKMTGRTTLRNLKNRAQSLGFELVPVNMQSF